MKEFVIRKNEAGQRFDKYLGKLMKEAPKSFFYKMMRKKNITLNGGKARGNEILSCGDCIRIFVSDETFSRFQGENKADYAVCSLDIVYEDAHIILINKPAGMLSQPADTGGEPSLVEYLIGYLLEKGAVTREELNTFRPGVCNRLDRNTSGIVAAGKSLAGLQSLSAMFHDRSIHKYYLCPVKGHLEEMQYIKGYLYKDEKQNKVTVYEREREGALPVETSYEPMGGNGDMTLLRVGLITGRPHQIRAHLASVGHPILGDSKYGDAAFNQRYGERHRLRHQLLHAYRLDFPEMTGELAGLSGRSFTAPVPELFMNILKEQHLEESYDEYLERNLGLCKNDNFCSGGGSDCE